MTTASGHITLENAEALADLGAILTRIGALVKKAYHRGECSVELTIYCVVTKGTPP
jgi:hypothetical protein